MSDVRTEKSFLRPTVRYTRTPLSASFPVFPPLFRPPPARCGTHTHAHATGNQRRRPFLHQPTNPKFTRTAPTPRWSFSATPVTASPRGVCRLGSRAAIPSRPAKHGGSARGDSAPPPRQPPPPPEAGSGSLLRRKHLLLPTSLSANHQCKRWQRLRAPCSTREGATCLGGRNPSAIKPAALPLSTGQLARWGRQTLPASPRSSTAIPLLPRCVSEPDKSPRDARKSTSGTPVAILWCPLNC
ncbi:uncharacterized protein DKFZp434B061-like [Tyto alba]|uniref:uncharacterized protein DKFZp434B061-like n=1 Tax=Tyto alba TaxID=56313 RepID=UPI001C665181|nr:uncharacterized protein DKFZp434B061-like [Tyto alba]